MKTILKIIVILLVASTVAAGIYAIVNNTTIGSALPEEGRIPPPGTTDASGNVIQRPTRPDGDFDRDFDGGREEGASAEGLLGIFGSLIKLSVLTAIILLIQKGLSLLPKRQPKLATG